MGNVTDITDGTGSIVESYSYDAYGNSLDTSSVGNPYLFNGRRFDDETGLYYYRARYYDPEIRRFLQIDPLGYYDNINLYSYVSNNPVNLTDPLGLEPPSDIPPIVDIQQNIQEAKNMSLFEFYNAVKSGGKWDYKQQGSQYEDFGNYNFGVAGRAAGFSDWMLKRGAGAYQIYSGTSRSEWGKPWGDSPYGDDPNDQQWINEGVKDYESFK